MDELSRRADAELLPQEAPLPMPVQDLGRAPDGAAAPRNPWGTILCRALVIGGALAMTAVATAQMSQVLGLARFTVTGLALTTLFAVLFVWLALSFTSALAGLPARLRRREQPEATLPRTRTALLMPIYNEDMARIAPGLAAMRAELAAAGAAEWFDVFVLSDSTDPVRRDTEGAAVRLLRSGPGPALYYRHRPENIDRKAGNIAEWVGRFGAAYEQFLILDADSLMDAPCLLALVAEMRRRPDTALLQTLPLLVGEQTMFARLQQFASHAYGPLIAAGIAAWHGAEGNYWGHNALIRTRAFAACCGLPHLPGRKPFGGTILSHDFVEAALLRRAGWAVRMLPGLPGSYEAGPPTLPDMAARDRRWCQGNVQHAAVLPARGLHWVSRLHMATGIAAYASAPLWMGFLLLGIAVAVQARFLRPEYFPQTHTLFPQWPVVDPDRAIAVFLATLLVLLAPKLLALATLLRDARGFGGTRRLIASVAIEIVLSALLSPVTMVTQARQFFQVLRGADSGWQAQRRDGEAMAWRDSWRFGRSHVMLGVLMLAIAVAVAPLLAAWMAPVLIGLVAAPWLVALSSGAGPGAWLRRRGLLATPAETMPSPILRAAAAPAPFCLLANEPVPTPAPNARMPAHARYPDHPWHPLPVSRPGGADAAPPDDPPAGQPRPAAARRHAHGGSAPGHDAVGA
jgi:membrane glycosyltransferase